MQYERHTRGGHEPQAGKRLDTIEYHRYEATEVSRSKKHRCPLRMPTLKPEFT